MAIIQVAWAATLYVFLTETLSLTGHRDLRLCGKQIVYKFRCDSSENVANWIWADVQCYCIHLCGQQHGNRCPIIDDWPFDKGIVWKVSMKDVDYTMVKDSIAIMDRCCQSMRYRHSLSWIRWAVIEALWSLKDWLDILSISMAKKKSLVNDGGVCDDRALLIVSLRALAAWMGYLQNYPKDVTGADSRV